jgi:hypothetical protein
MAAGPSSWASRSRSSILEDVTITYDKRRAITEFLDLATEQQPGTP